MDGMVFDAGTWWLITICVTALITLIGALVSRSVFKQLDKNGADIKEVRENYTPRSSHEKDMETLRTIHQRGWIPAHSPPERQWKFCGRK